MGRLFLYNPFVLYMIKRESSSQNRESNTKIGRIEVIFMVYAAMDLYCYVKWWLQMSWKLTF